MSSEDGSEERQAPSYYSGSSVGGLRIAQQVGWVQLVGSIRIYNFFNINTNSKSDLRMNNTMQAAAWAPPADAESQVLQIARWFTVWTEVEVSATRTLYSTRKPHLSFFVCVFF